MVSNPFIDEKLKHDGTTKLKVTQTGNNHEIEMLHENPSAMDGIGIETILKEI
jgi:hypothetical protein